MNTEVWLLLAQLTLATTRERVDVLVSIHTTETECVDHIMTRVPSRKGRRYDCRPLILQCMDLKP